MPTAAPGTIRFFDANGMVGARYEGRWVVNIPAFTAPGDGFINECDIEIAIPGVDPSAYTTGFYIGNDDDGDSTRFTGGVEIDSDAPPGWVTYIGIYKGNDVDTYLFDGNWDSFSAPFTITVDPASDPDWYLPAPGSPVFTSIAPTAGLSTTSVTISGTDLSSVSALYLRHDYGGYTSQLLSFTVVNATTLTASVPPGFPDGPTHVHYDWGGIFTLATAVTFEVLLATAPGAPANDHFVNAQLITGDAGSVTGTTTGATVQGGEPGVAQIGYGAMASVWYRWTPSVSMTAFLQLDTFTGNGEYSIIEVFAGSSVFVLTAVPSTVLGTFYGGDGGILVDLVGGTEYRIRVRSYYGGPYVGGFTLHWSEADVPANDLFVNAEVISGSSGSVAGTNVFAGVEIDEPPWHRLVYPYGPNDYTPVLGSVWYRWTAPSSGLFTFESVSDDEEDTKLDVFAGSSLTGLTLLAYNQWGLVDQVPAVDDDWSSVVFQAQAGVAYYIRVHVPSLYRARPFTLNWFPKPARPTPAPFVPAPSRVWAIGWSIGEPDENRLCVFEIGPDDSDWHKLGYMEVSGQITSVNWDFPEFYWRMAHDTVNHRNSVWHSHHSGSAVQGHVAQWYNERALAHVDGDPEDLGRLVSGVLFTAGTNDDPNEITDMEWREGSIWYVGDRQSAPTIQTLWLQQRDATTGALISSRLVSLPDRHATKTWTITPDETALILVGQALTGQPPVMSLVRWELDGSGYTILLADIGATYPHWKQTAWNPNVAVKDISFRPNGELVVHTSQFPPSAQGGERGHYFSVLTADGSSIIREYHHPWRTNRRIYAHTYDPVADGWWTSNFTSPGTMPGDSPPPVLLDTPYVGIDNNVVMPGVTFIRASDVVEQELPPIPTDCYQTYEIDITVFVAAAGLRRAQASIGRSRVRLVRISNLPKGS